MKKGVKQLLNKWTAVLLLICMTVGVLQMPGSSVEAEENTTPSLKAAILSDVHLGYNYGDLANGWKQQDWFKYILQWYKNADVDAVIIPGDLVDAADNLTATAETQFQEFFDVWNSVFTAKKGEEGYVEPILIYGNHDKWLSQNEASGKYWETYLGETFSPVYSKQVGGYWFVCVHDGFESENKEELKEKLDEAVAASNGAPVFYLQHSAIYQTTGASDGSVSGDVMTGFDVIKDYENVVALTGHTHRSIVNDASIWQGDDWNEGQFTTITCSTLAYGSFEDNDYTGNNLDPKLDSVKTKQGLIMNASGNNINVERYSFYTDEMVGLVEGTDTTQDYDKCVKSAGADWNFTVGGEKPYTFDECYKESIVPEFPEYAKDCDDLLETCSIQNVGFNNTNYINAEGAYVKDGRNVLRFFGEKMTKCDWDAPYIVVTLPSDVVITESDCISLDAWFSTNTHDWVAVAFLNQENKWITDEKGADYSRTKNIWDNVTIKVSDMTLREGYSLSDAKKIMVRTNVKNVLNGDVEYYFDNLKLLTTMAECSDTSATVTFPSASMSDGSMFKDYVVEARDVNSGVIKATATVNTEYRIDTDIESRYKDSYSVDVNGLLEDTAYDFYIYGRNFYGKCSTEPLVITAKTTGTRTSNGDEKGDVNGDFYTDVRDLVSLKKYADTAKNKDVDENGKEELETDKNGLLRILLGYTSVVQDSEKDLIGQSTYQSGTLLAGKKGYGIQTAVVNNTAENFTDSKAAYEVWATADGIGTSWGLGTNIYFDKAQDWSGTNTLNFDVRSIDNCATRSYEICLISGEQEVLSNKLWPKAAASTWSTVSIARSSFINVDWTNVKGIRFYMQFDADSGRYTGVEKSSFFVDNMYTSYTVVPDKNSNDLLESGTIAYGGYRPEEGYPTADGYCMKDDRVVLKFSRKAMTSCLYTYPYFTVTLPEDVSITADHYISMDGWFSTYAHDWFMIEYLDKDGTKIATEQGPNYSRTKNIWDNVMIQASTIEMKEGYSLSDIRTLKITSNVESYIGGPNLDKDIEYYFDNLKLLKTPYTFDGMGNGDQYEISQGCTLQPISGPLYGKEGEVFTKFKGGAGSGSPRININDSEFRNGLTAADSVSFWVYAPEQTGNVASLQLRLCDDVSQSWIFKNNVDIPFGKWTKITMTGDEMKQYISGQGLMIWTSVTRKDTSATNIYLELYLSDVEVHKGVYTAKSDSCAVSSIVGPQYSKEGDFFTQYTNGYWQAYPIIDIDDASFKSNLQNTDSIRFSVYVPTPTNTNVKAVKLYLHDDNDANKILYNTVLVPFDTWTDITLTSEQVQTYLQDYSGLSIRLIVEKNDSDDRTCTMYLSDVEIVKATN